MADSQDKILDDVTGNEYKYGFVTDIETETIPMGLNEDVVRLITVKMPKSPHLKIPEIKYQDIIYYAAPKQVAGPRNLEEVDPELLRTFDRLGIPLEEQKLLSGVAVDAVMDSVSVKTTFRDTLAELGIIFCSMSEAVREYPDLVKKY